jgi:hypothetical protein
MIPGFGAQRKVLVIFAGALFVDILFVGGYFYDPHQLDGMQPA